MIGRRRGVEGQGAFILVLSRAGSRRTMATTMSANKLIVAGEYVRTDGRTCYVDHVSNTLGYNEYHLIDIDSGTQLKRARYQLEPMVALNLVAVPDDNFERMADTMYIPHEKPQKETKKRFADVSVTELDQIEENRTSKRTRQQTVWAVSVFKGETLLAIIDI